MSAGGSVNTATGWIIKAAKPQKHEGVRNNMAHSKPFCRIYRPRIRRDSFSDHTRGYERDSLFLPDSERKSMIMAARLIIDDFEHLFEYVEPHTDNENVFSHRIYELFLRTCTEVESCCKGILIANGHAAKNMDDYKKVEQATHLSGYTVQYSNWLPTSYATQPFAKWATNESLPWYKAYNDLKHNRSQNFKLASLKNLLDAISGLLCIIHAQVGDVVQQVFESNIYFSSDEVDVTVRSFKINPYQLPDDEKYDFDWDNLKGAPNRIQNFVFV